MGPFKGCPCLNTWMNNLPIFENYWSNFLGNTVTMKSLHIKNHTLFNFANFSLCEVPLDNAWIASFKWLHSIKHNFIQKRNNITSDYFEYLVQTIKMLQTYNDQLMMFQKRFWFVSVTDVGRGGATGEELQGKELQREELQSYSSLLLEILSTISLHHWLFNVNSLLILSSLHSTTPLEIPAYVPGLCRSRLSNNKL